LHDAVAAGLALEWSPRQVSERLRRDYPEDMGMRISHEAIYETLFVQARGECRTQLRLVLRSGRVRRVPRGGSRPRQARISGMVNISERPAEAEDRAVPGHWESDLIIGARGRSQILTLVERATRFVILQKIPYDRCADRVALLLATAAQRLSEHLWRSITHDQGVEMAEHAKFTVMTNIPVFFCDPHSPWQRGSNENTVSLAVAREGRSGRVVPAARDDPREHWPPGACLSLDLSPGLPAPAWPTRLWLDQELVRLLA
jgi:transposase, IS30 family